MIDATQFRFRLYIAGESPNSTIALANLELICREFLLDRAQIEIVDVLREPMRAFDERILLTPTLVRIAPLPARKVVGNLKEWSAISRSLGLGAG